MWQPTRHSPSSLGAGLAALLSKPLDARPFSPVNPHFVPLKNSTPIPVWAAVLPPLAYYVGLTLLPPIEGRSQAARQLAAAIKITCAAICIASFAVLPFWYHVPGSAILTYQLGLVGCYGSCRAFDLFFLSHPHVPRRLAAIDAADKEGVEPTGALYPGTNNEQWILKKHPKGIAARMWWALDLMISSQCARRWRVRGVGWDFATPDVRHDTNPWQSPSKRQVQRAFFRVGPMLAACLLALRYMATSIDIQVHHLPREPIVELAGITRLPIYLRPVFVAATGVSLYALFDFGYTVVSAIAMPVLSSLVYLVAGKRSLSSSRLPSAAHNVDFYPLLNPVGLTAIRSVRSFWSKAWHRLFHRAFLIYGIVPFQNAAIRIEWAVKATRGWLTGSRPPPAPFSDSGLGKPTPSRHADPGRALRRGQGDWGKVLGAFFASGIIHAISERAALGGRIALPHMHLLTEKGWRDTLRHTKQHKSSGAWSLARLLPPFSGAGELSFFLLNGIAVVLETAFGRFVLEQRRQQWRRAHSSGPQTKKDRGAQASADALDDSDEDVKTRGDSRKPSSPSLHDNVPDEALHRPYDIYFQLAWTLTVLLTSGELFVEGWIASGVINEITMLGQ